MIFKFTNESSIQPEKPQLKLSRGRISRQGVTFLRSLSWRDAENVQKIYFDKFGVTYSKGTLLKYLPTMYQQEPHMTTKEPTHLRFSDGTIEVDGAGLKVTDSEGNSAIIELDMFNPSVVQKLSTQILYQLEDELTEEESIVEKLRAKIEAIKTLAH